MSSLSDNEFSESKAFNSHTICYIVINNFFVSFEISGGSYNSSQNTLKLTNEF